MMGQEPFVLECKTVDEANRVDTKIYRFERYSEARDAYIFIRRGGR